MTNLNFYFALKMCNLMLCLLAIIYSVQFYATEGPKINRKVTASGLFYVHSVAMPFIDFCMDNKTGMILHYELYNHLALTKCHNFTL